MHCRDIMSVHLNQKIYTLYSLCSSCLTERARRTQYFSSFSLIPPLSLYLCLSVSHSLTHSLVSLSNSISVLLSMSVSLTLSLSRSMST